MIMSSSVQGIGGERMYKEVQKGLQEARQPWPGWPGEKKKKAINCYRKTGMTILANPIYLLLIVFLCRIVMHKKKAELINQTN